MLITMADYARSRKERGLPGGTKAGVFKAVRDGRISLTQGKIDATLADRQWAEATNLKQQRTARKAPKGDDQTEQTSARESFSSAQARKETALANIRELEEAEKRGSLIQVSPIDRYVSGLITRAKDELLRIGPELRDQLASSSDPVKCEDLVSTRVARALEALSEYRPSAAA